MGTLIRFILLIFIASFLSFFLILTLSEGNVEKWLNDTAPLKIVALCSLIFSLIAFIFGIFSGDYSWVDRLWSTLPVGLAWVYVFRSEWALNLLIPAILISLWGIRLTFNFARRGGYFGMEDYRWAVLREKLSHPAAWQLFHFFFICLYQVGLFVLFTAPLQWIFDSGQFGVFPSWALLPFFFFLLFETAADQQQWNYQRQKRGIIDTGRYSQKELEQGFCSSGLFRLSRHPNYFGELGIWWSLYFIAAVINRHWWHWSIIGAGLLTLLFIGSTGFTESITVKKYSHYSNYQKKTSPVIPWIPRS